MTAKVQIIIQNFKDRCVKYSLREVILLEYYFLFTLLKEQCITRMSDNIYIEIFTDNLHSLQLISGDGTYDDAVMIVV